MGFSILGFIVHVRTYGKDGGMSAYQPDMWKGWRYPSSNWGSQGPI